MAELSKKVRAIEKHLGAHTRHTWSETEYAWLTMLATLSGLPVQKYPPYPYISGDIKSMDDVQRRAPAYQLWPRFERLRQYYQAGIWHVHTAMQTYRVHLQNLPGYETELPENCAWHPETVAEWRQAYAQTDGAKALLANALEPCHTDVPGEIPTRRNAYPWHSLPRAIAELHHIGFARAYASACLVQRLYSPYRHQWKDDMPTPPPFPTPRWYVESW
jgi:hypothetical protein